MNQSILATKAAGKIAQIGFLTGQTTTLSLMPLIFPPDNYPRHRSGASIVV
ncbi:hypothetical protein KO536_09875 [Pseudomonas sp. NKUCC02_KPG]|nr:hypothetical protein [Pseudomonas sp. NKUCC02_KPG]